MTPLPVPSLLVHGATLLTLDPDRPDPFVGWFTVGDDGRLSAVEEGAPPSGTAATRTVDATGMIVAPGFVSAHSHLFTSGSRGLGMDQSLYGWIEAMTAYTEKADAEDIYWTTRHGAQDFLRNGITTAYDFTDAGLVFEATSSSSSSYSNAVPAVEYQHAQLRAKADAGLRHVHSVMLAQGEFDLGEALAHVDETVARAADYADHPTHLGLAVSGTVQWADSPATAELEVAAMRRAGIMNQPHFLETPHGIAEQQAKFGWYRDAGALGPDLVFGHFIQTSPEIIAEAAAAGCGMSWQPMSNGRLASGVASIPEIRAAGMRVGVGLDDQSCTDNSDPFANTRFGMYLLRATRNDPSVMPVRDMLELHTRGSAEILGVDEHVGTLRVGRYADFLVVDPRDPDTGPVWDTYGTYVLACTLRNLKQVWSGGRLVAEGSTLTDPQAGQVSAETHARMRRLAEAVSPS
ncbi:MAG: amidohydrolase family protein [Pseudonocardia sp.]|nr:amidohydrolase family protein [Pseudonocardia sp.]